MQGLDVKHTYFDIIGGKTSPLYEEMLTDGLINTTFDIEYFEGFGYSAHIFSGESHEYEKVREYINEELGVNSVKDAISGASDIIAEIISDNAELRKKLRYLFIKVGVCSSAFAKGLDENDEKAGVYAMYKDFSEPVSQLKSHRVLALNRGEKEDALKVKISIDDNFACSICESYFVKGESPYKEIIKNACADAYDRLIKPSVEREVRNLLTEKAQEKAI